MDLVHEVVARLPWTGTVGQAIRESTPDSIGVTKRIICIAYNAPHVIPEHYTTTLIYGIQLAKWLILTHQTQPVSLF